MRTSGDAGRRGSSPVDVEEVGLHALHAVLAAAGLAGGGAVGSLVEAEPVGEGEVGETLRTVGGACAGRARGEAPAAPPAALISEIGSGT